MEPSTSKKLAIKCISATDDCCMSVSICGNSIISTIGFVLVVALVIGSFVGIPIAIWYLVDVAPKPISSVNYLIILLPTSIGAVIAFTIIFDLCYKCVSRIANKPNSIVAPAIIESVHPPTIQSKPKEDGGLTAPTLAEAV